MSPVTLDAERRLVYEDRVQVPRLYIQWPTVGFKHDDVAVWLESLAKQKGYVNPYFSSSTEALIGTRQTAFGHAGYSGGLLP